MKFQLILALTVSILRSAMASGAGNVVPVVVEVDSNNKPVASHTLRRSGASPAVHKNDVEAVNWDIQSIVQQQPAEILQTVAAPDPAALQPLNAPPGIQVFTSLLQKPTTSTRVVKNARMSTIGLSAAMSFAPPATIASTSTSTISTSGAAPSAKQTGGGDDDGNDGDICSSLGKWADTGMQVLIDTWYNHDDGLFHNGNALWWNSANMITTLAHYIAVRPEQAAQYSGIFGETFEKAQAWHLNGGNTGRANYQTAQANGFTNGYYDDSGWWGLAWVDAFDATGDHRFLEAAQYIFKNMTGSWSDTKCGGGAAGWGIKEKNYKNAVTNELFMTLGTSLASRGSGGDENYADWASKAANWLVDGSNLINSDGLVYDGVNGDTCDLHKNLYTYNQGILLTGLTGVGGFDDVAAKAATAAVTRLVDGDGILHESCERQGCHGDGAQFKGVFARHLAQFQTGNDQYKQFLIKNAKSVWHNARNSNNQFGAVWSGPASDNTGPVPHSSALDVIIGAYRAACQ